MTYQQSARRAFTLIELLFALVLVGIVGGAIARLVVAQQRFHASVAERLAMRARLRDGADLLAAAVRYAAVQGLPVALATDTAIELGTIIGAGTVCGASGARIGLAPESPTSGPALTSLAMTPDTTDDVLVFDRGAPPSTPHWSRAHVIDVTSRPASALCAPSRLVGAADLASRVMEVTPAAPLVARDGAPVRIVRRARFDVYRASDGLFYLGYRVCAAGCAGVQPVAGPYGSSAAVIRLRYFDVSGASLPAPLDVTSLQRLTRVDVVLRATSSAIVDLPGRTRGVARDSIVASIALRNAP